MEASRLRGCCCVRLRRRKRYSRRTIAKTIHHHSLRHAPERCQTHPLRLSRLWGIDVPFLSLIFLTSFCRISQNTSRKFKESVYYSVEWAISCAYMSSCNAMRKCSSLPCFLECISPSGRIFIVCLKRSEWKCWTWWLVRLAMNSLALVVSLLFTRVLNFIWGTIKMS